MTDQEKLLRLAKDDKFFTQIYNEYKDYSLRFFRKRYGYDDILNDIYQDAILVLLEKSKDPNFVLTHTIKTYLIAICKNQLHNKFKFSSKFTTKSDDFEPNIKDWFDEYDDVKEDRLRSIEKSLEKLKDKGEKCFEILKRFFYEKQSMDQIAVEMNYTNGDNVKNQKSRCQKKLKELVLENYDSI